MDSFFDVLITQEDIFALQKLNCLFNDKSYYIDKQIVKSLHTNKQEVKLYYLSINSKVTLTPNVSLNPKVVSEPKESVESRQNISSLIHDFEIAFSFQIVNQVAYLGYQATYAMPEYSTRSKDGSNLKLHNPIDKEHLTFMFDTWIQWLKNENVKSIHIPLFPSYLDETLYKTWSEVLAKLGFRMVYEEINQFIVIDKNQTLDNQLHAQEKRKLKKAKEQNFQTEISPFQYQDYYFEFIQNARLRKGKPCTTTQENLKNLAINLPENYWQALTSLPDHTLLAFCIWVQTQKNVWYYYLPADAEEYTSSSPMVRLLDDSYSFARSIGIEYLDLGISSVQGVHNLGLIQFKKNMGAQSCPKAVWSYEF